MSEIKVKINNLYKIFGTNPASMISRIMNGTSKQTLLDEHGHVLGLNDLSLELAAGGIQVIRGLSGSGKSTLVNHTIFPAMAKKLHQARHRCAPFETINGLEHFDKVIEIDQNPIGRTPRSNPATYTGLFTPIRELFAATPESRARGYKPGRFSFNVRGGRCESCQGDGLIKVEMHFLPDIYLSHIHI